MDRITELEDGILYLLTFILEWAKEVQPGLCPTMYGTGSEKRDRIVKEAVDKIRKLVRNHES